MLCVALCYVVFVCCVELRCAVLYCAMVCLSCIGVVMCVVLVFELCVV